MSDADITARLKLNAEQFSGQLDRALGNAEARAKSASAEIARAFSAARSVVGAIGIGIGARELGQMADQYSQITSRLKLATAESGSFYRAQADVQRIASETRAPLLATAELYATMSRNGAALGISQEQVARATETVNKAMRVSGGSTAAAEAGLTQLGQALASGVLRGDEFNSMMENSPRLAKLLADSIGVPIGALRAMAEEGDLTADKLIKALTDQKFTAGLDAEFKQMPVTFGEAATKIYNAALTVFGEFDQGGQFSTSIANFVSEGSDGLAELAERAREEGGNIRSAFTALDDVFDPLLYNGSSVFEALGLKIAPLRDQIADLLGNIDSIQNFMSAPDRFLNNVSRGIDDKLRGAGMGAIADMRGTDAPTPLANRRGRFLDSFDRAEAERRRRESDAFTRDLNQIYSIDQAMGTAKPRARYDPPDKDAEKAAKAAARKAEQQRREAEQKEKAYQADVRSNEAELHFLDLRQKDLDDQAELEERLFRLRESSKDLSATQLAVLEKQTTEIFNQEKALEGRDKAREEQKRSDEEAARAAEQELRKQQRQAEDAMRDISAIFYDAMTGNSGNIWSNFKRMGLKAIADLAAQWTLSQLAGGNVGMPQGMGGSGGILSVLFGGGGIGGAGGVPDLSRNMGWDGSVNPPGSISLMSGIGSLGTSIFGKGFGYDPAAMRLAEASGGSAQAAQGMAGLGQLGAGLGAAAMGMQVPGMLGLKGSTTGGVLGGAAGMAIGGPLGAAIGAALGSFVGGLFKKNPYGTANVTGVSSMSVGGNKGGARDNAGTAGGSVQEGIARLADQFGVDVGGFNVSIGTYKGKYRVSPGGKTGKLSGGDVVDFGKEGGQQAVEFAVRDAIADGALKGISAASQKILSRSKDLESAITKASLIESIPKRLKAIDDPLGAATDDLVAEFRKIKAALDEGGGTAQQYADAEKLFNKEREALVERVGDNARALKDYADSLKLGGNSPLSLRDQRATADAKFAGFEAQIRGGQTVDQDKFTAAARALLDVSRGMNASSADFFTDYNRVSAATEAAIKAVNTAPTNYQNPFAEKTANAAIATADGVLQTNKLLAQLLARMGGALPPNFNPRFGFVK